VNPYLAEEGTFNASDSQPRVVQVTVGVLAGLNNACSIIIKP